MITLNICNGLENICVIIRSSEHVSFAISSTTDDAFVEIVSFYLEAKHEYESRIRCVHI